jgi:hypothetical protein
MTFLLIFLIFLPKILLGFALIHLFWEELDVSSIVTKIGLAIPVGMAVSSSLLFVSMLMGIPPKTYSLLENWIFPGAAILLILFLRARVRTNWKFSKLSWQEFLFTSILIAGLGLMIYAFLFYSKMHPYGFEDAWSIWNFSARYIHRMNSPAFLFNQQYYEAFHPDYPIGLGLNVAWGWFVLNSESTNLPIVIALYIIFAPVLLLWGALNKWKGILPATLAALLYAMLPNLQQSVGQGADSFLALYMLSAIVMLYGYLRSSQPGFLFLAGLTAGYSAWIKNEGLLFVCIFLIIIAFMGLKNVIERGNLKWIAGGLFVPLLVVIVYKLVIHAPNDLFSGDHSVAAQLLDVQRWWTIARNFSLYIFRYGDWPVSIVIVLGIYVILMGFDGSEWHRQIWLLLAILGQLAGYFFVYLITPHDLAWHITTSMDRLISHLLPMVIFWLFIALRLPELKQTEVIPTEAH